MFQIVEGDSRELADVQAFIDLINDPPVGLGDFFDETDNIFVARSPGRLDVMGGIADYSGSLVLQIPIAEATLAAFQVRSDELIKIVSTSKGSNTHFKFQADLSELLEICRSSTYEQLRDQFSSNRRDRWAAYVAGVLFILQRELGVEFNSGIRILIASNIPIGKGVSSSAALEVAVMNAVCAAFDIQVEPRQLALLCQIVENKIVGASCGVMDQISTNCGVENALISILCQPAEIKGTITIPESIEFWGIDSGVRHSVAGSDYSSVRVAAFMGYRMIAELAGFDSEKISGGIVEIRNTRWHGYLCNVCPAEYEAEFMASIPISITGADFINKFGGTTDPVTRIDPATTYAVRASAEHAIYENARVNAFSEIISRLENEVEMTELGELMLRSHQSYAACGLTESGTDRIVELVRQQSINGLFGARITGGGSGGTVCVLARKGSSLPIKEIAEQYEGETGRKPYIFSGSSIGAARFGHIRLSSVRSET